MRIEFDTYQLFIHSEPKGYRIIQLFMDYNLVGQIEFHPTQDQDGAKLVNGHIHLQMRTEDYPQVVDIIRNEAPVYLFYNEASGQGGVSTDPTEPVGEGEH